MEEQIDGLTQELPDTPAAQPTGDEDQDFKSADERGFED